MTQPHPHTSVYRCALVAFYSVTARQGGNNSFFSWGSKEFADYDFSYWGCLIKEEPEDFIKSLVNPS